jgi:hypothetical protein
MVGIGGPRNNFPGIRLALVALLLVAILRTEDGLAARVSDLGSDTRAGMLAQPGQWIVGFQESSQAADREAAVASRGARTIRKLDSIDAYLLEMPWGASLSPLRTLTADPVVRYAEPNVVFRAVAFPDDPGLASQWALTNGGQGVPPAAGIDATSAWDVTTGSREIDAGVVDTGVDYAHPDLAANIWRAPPGWSIWGLPPWQPRLPGRC